MISEPLGNDGFVGRREELAFLHESFVRARDERARFVPIEGEAGIGKSRLIDEFSAAIAPEATLASGQCSEQVRSPYFPFSRILAQLDRAVRGAPSSRGSAEATPKRRPRSSRARRGCSNERVSANRSWRCSKTCSGPTRRLSNC